MASLDYTRFPHIFRAIVEQSDLGTQLAIRLTSSLAKAEVDRVQCEHVALMAHYESETKGVVVALKGPPLLTSVPSERGTARWSWYRLDHGAAPFINFGLETGKIFARLETWRSASLDEELDEDAGSVLEEASDSEGTWGLTGLVGRREEVAETWEQTANMHKFAVMSARRLYLHEHFADLHADSLLHASPAANLTLFHGEDWPRPQGQSRAPRTVCLPPVQQLQVVFGAPHTCSNVAEHSSPTVKLVIRNRGTHTIVCPFVLSLFRPWVKVLTLECDGLADAALFMEGLHGTGQPAHPELKVVVICSIDSEASTGCEALQRFHAMWERFADVSVSFTSVRPAAGLYTVGMSDSHESVRRGIFFASLCDNSHDA